MTSVRDVFPSLRVCADDLDDRDHVVTMCAIVYEEITAPQRQKGEKRPDSANLKPVLYFQEWPKGLVLNTTCATTISGLYGPIENWPGKRITLYSTQEKSFGEMKDVVRVRPDRPAVTVAASTGLKPRLVPRVGMVLAGNLAQRGAGPARRVLSGDEIKARWHAQNDEAATLGIPDWPADIPNTDPATGQKLPARWYMDELTRRQVALDEEFARQRAAVTDDDDEAQPTYDPATGERLEESEAA